MNKIIDYRLACVYGEVPTLLSQGWHLYGDPLLNTENFPVQAMVKYFDENADIRIEK